MYEGDNGVVSCALAEAVERPVSRTKGLSRREVLRFWSGVSAGAASASGVSIARAAEVSADVDASSLLIKLIRRITNGVSAVEVAAATQRGYAGYLEYHLDPAAINDAVLEAMLAGYPSLSMTYPQLLALENSNLVANEMIEASLLRACLSRRQLYERMVEFWLDHFHISIAEYQELRTMDERTVIRPNALATFPALLGATARSAAMLNWLDNHQNTALNPNENYGRELMELHTLGVNGGYTQQDVKEVSRCFTGWGFYYDWEGASAGTFRYRNSQHDQGQKVVLGNIIPANGGMQDGVTVLSILSEHPSTAGFIAKKLCRWLLGESTPAGVINAVKSTYQATGGDIKAMIRTALKPEHLYDAEPRYKRPRHLAASAVRGLSAGMIVTLASGIRTHLARAGHDPFFWPAPDGYPDTFQHWGGLMLPRWNFAASMAVDGVNGLALNLSALFAGLTTADQIADALNTALFAGEMPSEERNRLRDFLAPGPTNTSRQRDAIGLAVSSPSFQWY
jgi:uncharacterized protein (DUF1800 family)